jgi:glycosyltransferase involved in cell wall biosynthesis
MRLVSIILPTYNRCILLLETIQTVLRQTYAHFELLIIDDGSTDETKEQVLAITDDRIRYFFLPHSGRISAVRNYGLKKAKGELIAFIDSDDGWKEDKLQKQLELLIANPDIGFSVTDVTTYHAEQILIPHTFQSDKPVVCANIFPWLTGNRFIMYGSVLMVRKACLDKLGFYNEQLRDGDILFNMQLAYHFKAGVIYEPLTLRRIHETNISKQLPLDYYEEYLFTFSYLYSNGMISKRRLKQARSLANMKMAKIYAEKGDRQRANKHFLQSLRNNLFYPKHVLLLLKTFLHTKPLPQARV